MFLVPLLVIAPSSDLCHLSIRSSFVDVSGPASGRGSKLPLATLVGSHLRHLLIRLSIVLVSGLVSGRGSELPFGTLVDQIELRRCFWSRF